MCIEGTWKDQTSDIEKNFFCRNRTDIKIIKIRVQKITKFIFKIKDYSAIICT